MLIKTFLNFYIFILSFLQANILYDINFSMTSQCRKFCFKFYFFITFYLNKTKISVGTAVKCVIIKVKRMSN